MATYKPTTAFWKIHKLIKEGLKKYNELEQKTGVKQKVIFIIQGGAGAGKTIATKMLLIDSFSTNKKTHRVTVASDELTKMRDTVVMDFQNIAYDWGIYDPNKWNDQKARYLFAPSKFIEFKGLDKVGVGKGRRREIVFINEANKISSESFEDITLRAEMTIIDYNPDKTFWAKELINEFNFISLTFQDNEFLSEQERANIQSYQTRGYDEHGNIINEYWANKWRVYGLGLEGRVDGVIFQNWTEGVFPEELPAFYGMDFGWKDPTTLIKCSFDAKEKKVYVKEMLYASEMQPNMVIDALQNLKIPKNALILGDYGSLSQIHGIAGAGYNIRPCVKDIVVNGIRHLQDWEIIVDPSSTNFKKELHNYVWLDRVGEVPIGTHNHLIDPLRYCEHYFRHLGRNS
jgi:phage terminase large subunit